MGMGFKSDEMVEKTLMIRVKVPNFVAGVNEH